MSQYEEIDRQIIAAIAGRRNPIYYGAVCMEAERIAHETGHESFRIIDRRLQALRKAGKIKHYRKRDRDDGIGGWHLVDARKAS
jgi:hypothetical protein